jgi:hypothetical protein
VRATTRAAATSSGAGVASTTELGQGRHAGRRLQDHVAALAAVATIGSAARDMRLSSERGRTVAAGTRGHQDPRLVSEHGADDSNGPRATRGGTSSASGDGVGDYR